MIVLTYQQLDAVHKLLTDAKTKGGGQNGLTQNSAGSGKSNTIAWAAHQIINLHDDEDGPLFDTAIIVTDRLVFGGFAQTAGVVKNIDGTPRDQKQAIEGGARIIIPTIQKFRTEHL
ncbi:hypothetical protein [Thalassovita taeanensis]|uniref:hypothetical protein n=1 Tax=Thalassovita taeanensis TaxID=657014 RepID=UPI001114E3CC|nr:hypothetical protein [Thalassovita taeanensis]